MRYKPRWTPSSQNMLLTLCGGVLLLAASSTYGRPLLQQVPSPAIAAAVASPDGAAASPMADRTAENRGGAEPDRSPARYSPTPTEVAVAERLHDLTLMGKFMPADIIVKAVMLEELSELNVRWMS
jgi:hypothetical protein